MRLDFTFCPLLSETEKSGEEKEKEHHSLEFNASFTPTVAKILTGALGEKRCTCRRWILQQSIFTELDIKKTSQTNKKCEKLSFPKK